MRTFPWFLVRCIGLLLFAPVTVGQNPPNSPQNGPAPGTPLPPRSPRGQVMATGMAANGGSILNGVYSNSVYEFSLQIPAGWAVLPTQSAKIAGTETVDAQRPEVQRQLKQVILIMSENAPLKKSVERKQVQIIATQLPAKPGPTAAEGYLTYSQQMAKDKGLPVEYKGAPKKTTIHDQPFSTITLEETTEGSRQHIEQYVTTRGQALLQFLLISPDEAGLTSLEPVIQSVRFKPKSTKATRKKTAAKKSASKPQK